MSYTVNATRSDGVWHVEVVEIDRVTQARTLKEVEVMARDLIDIMTGDTNPTLDIKIGLPDVALKHLREVDRLREVEAKARADASYELREAALALRREGLSMRDLGDAIGVSHQRASQLTSGRR